MADGRETAGGVWAEGYLELPFLLAKVEVPVFRRKIGLGFLSCIIQIMIKEQTIIFDLDGTAIDSPDSQVPTERVVRALSSAEATYNLCAATGRVWSFAKPVLQALRLTDPCIVGAGTQICDPQSGDILWESVIPADGMEEVVKVLQKVPQYKVLYNDYDEATYFSDVSMPIEDAARQPVHFLGLIFVPEKEAAQVMDSFSHIGNITCTLALAQRPGYNDILITNKGATKEHAIAELLKILKTDRQHTTGIGDGHNDIHIFNAVQHKVAMGNAVPDLKQMADEVIGSVKEDGLAKYLEGLVKS